MSRQTSSRKGTTPPVRHKNTTAIVPIVYGSISFSLGKKANEDHTHRWTLYVRGPNNEDLSVAISKVVFHLHPSFPQPVRELKSPPFEVSEKGWGEFEATIRIVWNDPHERATVLTHFIKLYPTPGTDTENKNQSNKSNSTQEPVLHEFYDEVVFTDPTESFYESVQRWQVLAKVKSNEESIHEYLPTYSDDDDFKSLLEAERFLEQQLIEVKDRILNADRESESLDAQIKSLTASPKTVTSTPVTKPLPITATGKKTIMSAGLNNNNILLGKGNVSVAGTGNIGKKNSRISANSITNNVSGRQSSASVIGSNKSNTLQSNSKKSSVSTASKKQKMISQR